MSELKYLVALHSLPGMGTKRLKILVDYFQNYEYAWQGDKHWLSIPGFPGNGAEQILEARRNLDPDRVYEKFLQSQARIVTQEDEAYPRLLKNIYDPPYLLYYQGSLPAEDDLCIALVGSRRSTPYGRHTAETIARELAEKGVWVISGLARGIDTWSHRGCLKGGGKTVAVLGSGIDLIYPRENKDLFREIISMGAVISEFPPGTPPLPQHFPARNRIISGMSRGVVVVEAAEKSGSLITVDFALEHGRDVFAVPGPVTSIMSRGTHRLIRQGAKLVENAFDILEEYLEVENPPVEFDLFSFSPKEREILELMMGGAAHFDVLVEKSGLPAGEMASQLTLWEIKGLIKQLPGKYYILKN
ncbi:MAG: DNA-processing protein DprA [Bacillota bacterium]